MKIMRRCMRRDEKLGKNNLFLNPAWFQFTVQVESGWFYILLATQSSKPILWRINNLQFSLVFQVSLTFQQQALISFLIHQQMSPSWIINNITLYYRFYDSMFCLRKICTFHENNLSELVTNDIESCSAELHQSNCHSEPIENATFSPRLSSAKRFKSLA